jgi:tripeptide aminopeptidase
VHRNYAGGALLASPKRPNWCCRPETSPNLAKKVGYDIVTASGATILGADDKCGVAIVMAMANELLHNSSHRAWPRARLLHPRRGDRPRRRSAQLPADLMPQT